MPLIPHSDPEADLTPQDLRDYARILEQAGDFQDREWTQLCIAREDQVYPLPQSAIVSF